MVRRVMVGVVLVAGLLVPGPRASAATIPIQTGFQQGQIPANGILSLKAKCPAGTRLISGGAKTTGAGDASSLVDSYPIDGKDADTKPDDGWKATIRNADVVATAMQVHAVCSGAGKYKYMKEKGDVPTGGSSTVQVFCPAGAKVTGGGVKYNKGLVGQSLGATRPVNDNGWFVGLNNASAEIVPTTAYAICETTGLPIYVPAPLPLSMGAGDDEAYAPACSADQVVGGGVGFDTLDNTRFIRYSSPIAASPGDAPSQWEHRVKNVSGSANVNWYVICHDST